MQIKVFVLLALAICPWHVTGIRLTTHTQKRQHIQNEFTIRAHPPVDACPATSHVFTADPTPRPDDGAAHRVMVAGAMSAGSGWIRKLLSEASGKPTCAVYPREGCKSDKLVDAYCKPTCTGARDGENFYVKTHWPQSGWVGGTNNFSFAKSVDTLQMMSAEDIEKNVGDPKTASNNMRFSKLVLLVRHPLAQISSFTTRWSGKQLNLGKVWGAAQAVYCWSAWWSRVAEQIPPENLLVIRYEDVCNDPDVQTDRLLSFLEYERKHSGHSYQNRCKKHPEVKQYEANFNMVQDNLTAELEAYLTPHLKAFGYVGAQD